MLKLTRKEITTLAILAAQAHKVTINGRRRIAREARQLIQRHKLVKDRAHHSYNPALLD